ncbi:MAG: hypothetical protein BroJett030_28880 [Alphaproteobacteria bacterium]|nr:MAG: hypothetical protein BroJett030_28880 [Alphaproteobacteria bacterium]
MALIVVLSGHAYSGKSELARNLQRYFDFDILSTSEILRAETSSESRRKLQQTGDAHDEEDGGRWLVEAIKRKIVASKKSRFCIDRARKNFQLDQLRAEFGWQIAHIHIDCPIGILRERHKKSGKREDINFEELLTADDANVKKLRRDADFVINSQKNTELDSIARVAGFLKLLPAPDKKCVDVLIGGQYGSEGKGQVAAYLAREYDILVRVGGPNAGHSVISESGKFVYHHLPSGSRDVGAKILIGAGAVINEQKILAEISKAGISASRIKIDPDCIVITENDIAKENEILATSIGSTAQGVGYAAARKIIGRGTNEVKLARNFPSLRRYVGKVVYELERAYAENKRILLEGTQGSGLSLHHGEYPYVTSRDTNVAGCLSEAGISPGRVNRIIMVVRTHPIRVASPAGGTSGPISREIMLEEVCRRSGVSLKEAEKAEVTSTTGRRRRFGEFDWYLFRKSCTLNAPTDIALTFSDYISVENRKARRFDQLTQETILFVEELERLAHCPVSLISTRFDQRSIIDRRNWGTVRGHG